MRNHPVETTIEQCQSFEHGSISPLGGNISPSTTVSELSVDSGVGSVEDLGLGLEQELKDGGKVSYSSETLDLLKQASTDCESSPVYENVKFVRESSRPHERSFVELTESLYIGCSEPITPPPQQFSDNHRLVTSSQGQDANKFRHKSAQNDKPCEYKKGRQRHYTDNDCMDTSKRDAFKTPSQIYHDNDLNEKDMGKIWRTQNHSMIDVKTLRKRKVSNANLEPHSYYEMEVSSIFKCKKMQSPYSNRNLN